MTNAAVAELYFIAAMMILIMILSVGATYIFFRQYKLEKKNKHKINEQARAEAKKEYVEK
jgi:Na+/melibiose symporter-like transporter